MGPILVILARDFNVFCCWSNLRPDPNRVQTDKIEGPTYNRAVVNAVSQILSLWLLGSLCLVGCSLKEGEEASQAIQTAVETGDKLSIEKVEIEFARESLSPPRLTFSLSLQTALQSRLGRNRGEAGERAPIPVDLEVALVETINDQAKVIAKSMTVEGHIDSNGKLGISEVSLAILNRPQADYQHPQANRPRWDLHFRLTPKGEAAGLGVAEATLPYQPGRRSGTPAPREVGSWERSNAPAAPNLDPAALRPRLFVRTAEYRFLGRDFEVDRFLKLTQLREYRITLNPKIIHPYVFQAGGQVEESPREGERYRLILTFAARGVGTSTRLENKRYLGRYETEVAVDAHQQLSLSVPLVFDFTEEPYLDSGIELFVEIAPTTQVLTGTTSSVPFEFRRPYISGLSLNPEPLSSDELERLLVPKEMPRRRVEFVSGRNRGTIVRPELPWLKSPYELATSAIEAATKRTLEKIDVSEGNEADERLGALSFTRAAMREFILSEAFRSAAVEPALPAAPQEPEIRNLRPLFTRSTSTIQCHRPANEPAPRLNLRGYDNLLRPRAGASPAPDLTALIRGGAESGPRLTQVERRFPNFEVRAFKVVDEVMTPKVAERVITHLDWAVTASFFNESSEFERDLQANQVSSSWEGSVMGYVNVGAGVEAEAGFKFLGNGGTAKAYANAGVEGRYGWVHRNQDMDIKESGTMTNRRERITVSENARFFVEQRTLTMDLKIQYCLLLTPKANQPALKQYLVCAKRRESPKESWYYISDYDLQHEQPVERRDLRERLLIKLVRGKDAYNSFKRLMTDQAKQFDVKSAKLVQVGVSPLLHDAFLRRDTPHSYFRDGGKFPGVLEIQLR